jgi:hypothetical protein
LKISFLIIIGIVLVVIIPSLAYGRTIPMSSEEVIEYTDLIILGTITNVSDFKDKPPEFQINVEEVIKPKSFDGQNIIVMGCDPNRKVFGVPCPTYDVGQRGLFLISKSDSGYKVSFSSRISEPKCSAQDFLATYRGNQPHFFWTQDGQSDIFFTGKPVDINFVVRNSDMKEKDYSVQLTARTSGFSFSDVVNGTISECVGFEPVKVSFVPTKMGRYGSNSYHDTGGSGFSGIAIIDHGSSPLKQRQSGIGGQDTWCNDGLILVLRNDDTKAVFDNKPACVKPDTVSKLAERNLIELSSFYHHRPLIERLYAGMAILQFSDIPITIMGVYDQDRILRIGINEDELDKIPNAQDHFDRTIRETIPFNVPLEITFEKYWGG